MAGVKITDAFLKARSGQFDLESIQWLDCSNMGIAKMEAPLNECTELKDLKLAGGKIKHIECLEGMVKLYALDLSHNRLASLDGLERCTNLTTLSLQGNALSDPAELAKLSPLKSLRVLSLAGAGKKDRNPVVDHPSYTAVVLRALPSLEMLDGEHMVLKEAAQKAMLDSVDVDEAEIEKELPESVPWTKGVDMTVPTSKAGDDAVAARAARELQEALVSADDLDAEAKALMSRMKREAGGSGGDGDADA